MHGKHANSYPVSFSTTIILLYFAYLQCLTYTTSLFYLCFYHNIFFKKINHKSSSSFFIVLFGMLSELMYASKIIMELFPNIHLLGIFVIAITVVFRKKVLYPIYTCVFINGFLSGFSTWWIPYLYV